jgi:hypothetical protein
MKLGIVNGSPELSLSRSSTLLNDGRRSVHVIG